MVSIVNARGSRSGVNSLQRNGAETVASGVARAEYTLATVLPRMFWRKSTYTALAGRDCTQRVTVVAAGWSSATRVARRRSASRRS